MKENSKFADVPIRVRSWVYIVVIFATGVLHPVLTALLFTVLSAQSIREYLSLQKVKNNLVTFLPLLIIEFFCAYLNLYWLFIGSAISYCFSIGMFNKIYSPFVVAVMISVIALGHLPFLIHLSGADTLWGSITPLLFLVMLTELNDVFQYLTGKTWGKHQAFPLISPNKTREGCIGGMLLTTLLSVGLGELLLPEFDFWICACLGLLISLLGLIGDLFISHRKRLAGVKDTGMLIPGHGGLLDRLDSLIFITPVYYWILRWTI